MPRRSRSRSQKSKSRKSHSYKKRARPQKRSSHKRPTTVHRRRRLSAREANQRTRSPYSVQFAAPIRQRAPQPYAMKLSKPAYVPVPSDRALVPFNRPVSDAKAEAIMKEEAAKFF